MFRHNPDTRYGQFIYVENDSFIGTSITQYGENDYLEYEFLKQYIHSDDVILDIGAHVGTMTLPFARHVNQGRVYAFEAQPMLYYALCGNVAVNNLYNVSPMNCAIDKHYSSRNLFCYPPERTDIRTS